MHIDNCFDREARTVRTFEISLNGEGNRRGEHATWMAYPMLQTSSITVWKVTPFVGHRTLMGVSRFINVVNEASPRPKIVDAVTRANSSCKVGLRAMDYRNGECVN
jgi:hypothetical protein